MPGFGRHCVGLRKLDIPVYIESFNSRDDDLVNLLSVPGPTLESLEILCSPTLRAPEFEQVQDLCPNLSSIAFRVREDGALSAFADLLCSYDSQVQYTVLGIVPSALCAKLVASCNNFRCKFDHYVQLEDIDDALEELNVLGPCVQSIQVEISEIIASAGEGHLRERDDAVPDSRSLARDDVTQDACGLAGVENPHKTGDGEVTIGSAPATERSPQRVAAAGSSSACSVAVVIFGRSLAASASTGSSTGSVPDVSRALARESRIPDRKALHSLRRS